MAAFSASKEIPSEGDKTTQNALTYIHIMPLILDEDN
jgi:hypothetical protein